MINWENILEGVIATLIGSMITGGVGTIIYQFGKKGKFLKNPKERKFELNNFTPFSLSLMIVAFFTVLSGFSFYYHWVNMPYLITITILLWLGAGWVHNNQCPSCNKIFKKKHVNRETLNEEKIPHEYYDEIIYKYRDGSFKERAWGKKKKRWVEIVRVVRDHFVCNECRHEWDSSIKRITVNESDRPKPTIKITKAKNPDTFELN